MNYNDYENAFKYENGDLDGLMKRVNEQKRRQNMIKPVDSIEDNQYSSYVGGQVSENDKSTFMSSKNEMDNENIQSEISTFISHPMNKRRLQQEIYKNTHLKNISDHSTEKILSHVKNCEECRNAFFKMMKNRDETVNLSNKKISFELEMKDIIILVLVIFILILLLSYIFSR